MIDRTTAPAFNILKKVHIPDVQSASLSNGRSVFHLSDNTTQVFKIDIAVKAGSWYSSNYAVVPLTLKMLNEGTSSKTAKELADTIDKYGSFIELAPGFDHCTISLYGLTKYFSENLDILSELMLSPAFSQQSFDDLKRREVQKLDLNLEKGSYLASVSLRQNTFGSQHPYGRRILPNDVDSFELSDVKNFYHNHFNDFDILVSGNLPVNFLQRLDTNFGSTPTKQSSKPHALFPSHSPEKKISVRNAKFIQSSIRIGKELFNRSHKDYRQFMVLNEILGGYFGSRLMKNIREEKGFTYGIYSQLYSLNNAGYFSIGTDVNSENELETVEEIYKEIEALRIELVTTNELETVKNYMTGTFAGSINSPFSIIDKFRAVYYQDLDLSFFQSYIETINSTNSSDLSSLAHDYLQPDSFSIITIGK